MDTGRYYQTMEQLRRQAGTRFSRPYAQLAFALGLLMVGTISAVGLMFLLLRVPVTQDNAFSWAIAAVLLPSATALSAICWLSFRPSASRGQNG